VRNNDISKFDQRLLSLIERRFPLVERPFEALAHQLDCSAGKVIDRLDHLKNHLGVIREIAGAFEARLLGYEMSLVAVAADLAHLRSVAEFVNSHPGVSHNYLRWPTDIAALSNGQFHRVDQITSHVPAASPYNLWFTLAMPRDSELGIEGVLRRLRRLEAVEFARTHPVQKRYKLNVRFFHSVRDDKPAAEDLDDPDPMAANEFADRLIKGDHMPRRAVMALQQDLPLTDQPFRHLARDADLSVEQLLQLGREALAAGVMRKYRAVLNQDKSGIQFSVMLALQPSRFDEQRLRDVFAGQPYISHAYQRVSYPDWPFELFAMLHWPGDLPGCVQQIHRLLHDLASSGGLACWTVKEYCKRSVKYFSDAFGQWESSQQMPVQ